MQLIIDGGDQTSRQHAVYSRFPVETTSYYHPEKVKTKIPVAAIRQLITTLSNSSSITRLVWIEEASDLTIASQNTLLKILEEPPANTHFIFSLSNHRSLLPTILSRCTLTHLPTIEQEPDSALLQQLKKNIEQASLASRLNFAATIGKDREEVTLWFDHLLSSLSTTMGRTNSYKSQKLLSRIASSAMTAKEQLSQNGNVTLVRDHFFLTLPKTK